MLLDCCDPDIHLFTGSNLENDTVLRNALYCLAGSGFQINLPRHARLFKILYNIGNFTCIMITVEINSLSSVMPIQ